MRLRFWTEERVERLKQLADEGLSSSQMGTALGISRNAALGKLHRLGLCSKFVQHPQSDYKPRPANPKAYKRKPKIKRDRWRGMGTDELHDLPLECASNPTPLVDLDPDQCRWPVSGEGRDMLFCAAPKLAGYSYCPHHCARAFSTQPKLTRAEFEIHQRKLTKSYRSAAA